MVKILAKENGPYVVKAEGKVVRVQDGKEVTLEEQTLYLCRCGGSSEKPFCDGTHKKIGFQAKAEEFTLS